jgi:hypothetical protein
MWIVNFLAASEGFKQENFSWRYIEASMDYKECRSFREYKPLRKTLRKSWVSPQKVHICVFHKNATVTEYAW